MESQDTVRAFFRATKVENASAPYDTIHLKVYYPAQLSGNNQEKQLGTIPPKSELSPFPVVIFFNGFNCSPEIYQWLAIDLAKRGLVVVTFAWVAQNLPGIVSLTPGVDVNIWSPDNYGTAPTASALPALLKELETLQSEGLLAGLLDLERVILGGHSAGGRVAIESASKTFFPQLAGAFSYAGHTAGTVDLGFEPNTILPLPDNLPLLLLGGTCDGVIANSSNRYGVTWETPATPIARTFQEAVTGGNKDKYFVILEGANHFSIAYPRESTTGRGFLDFPATQPESEIRPLMASIIGLFIEGQICQKEEALQRLQNLFNSDHPLIARRERK